MHSLLINDVANNHVSICCLLYHGIFIYEPGLKALKERMNIAVGGGCTF